MRLIVFVLAEQPVCRLLRHVDRYIRVREFLDPFDHVHRRSDRQLRGRRLGQLHVRLARRDQRHRHGRFVLRISVLRAIIERRRPVRRRRRRRRRRREEEERRRRRKKKKKKKKEEIKLQILFVTVNHCTNLELNYAIRARRGSRLTAFSPTVPPPLRLRSAVWAEVEVLQILMMSPKYAFGRSMFVGLRKGSRAIGQRQLSCRTG